MSTGTKVTRSGRVVKSVQRYEPEEVNLDDDYSDGSFGDSDFDGSMDGMSVGSHVENSQSEDSSYRGGQTEVEDDEEDDATCTSTDTDSVITEYVPEEEILEIPSGSEIDGSGSDDESSQSDSSSSESSSSSSESSSSESESSDDEQPVVRKAWKKPRRKE